MMRRQLARMAGFGAGSDLRVGCKPYRVINVKGEHMAGPSDSDTTSLAIALAGMQEALRRCMLKICEAGDASAELDWFSELEDELAHRAKNAVIEGAAMSDETTVVNQAIAYIGFAFEGVRRDVSNKTER